MAYQGQGSPEGTYANPQFSGPSQWRRMYSDFLAGGGPDPSKYGPPSVPSVRGRPGTAGMPSINADFLNYGASYNPAEGDTREQRTNQQQREQGHNPSNRDPQKLNTIENYLRMPPTEWTGESLYDTLRRLDPKAVEGRSPSKLEKFLVERGKSIGTIVGLLTGIPGLGWLAGQLQDLYWRNNAWQNPAPPDPNYPNPVQQLVNNIDDQNPGSDRSLRELAGGNQSPIEEPRQYYGRMGPWTGFDTSSGREWEYRYTGPIMGAGSGGVPTTSAWWVMNSN